MRAQFHRDLGDLDFSVIVMCDIAVAAIVSATTALAEVDLSAAERTTALSSELTALRAPVESQARALLALQAPVGRDLRRVVASIHLIGDIVRMGQLARHIARIARRQHPYPAGGPGREILLRMGILAHKLGLEAHNVLVGQDPADAAAIEAHDHDMDLLRTELFMCVMAPASGARIPDAVDAVLLGRFYERFGDHAVAVGQHVINRSTTIRASNDRDGAGDLRPES